MKDFTINKKDREKYIKDVKKKSKAGQAYYEIKFADGRKFKNITCNDENINKIINKQEEQAQKGLENANVFKKKESHYKFTTIVGAVCSGLIGYAPVYDLVTNGNVQTLPLAAGTACVSATVYMLINYINNKGKVLELNKIKYRNDNEKELSEFKNYENSLNGLDSATKNVLNKTKKPFSIINLDNYSKKDLETIKSNIEREKSYQFTYNNTTSKTK